jgi:hypothetical protein
MRVLEVSVEDGILGCCTEKCYNAKTDPSVCLCICRGKNHGKGEQFALEHANDNALRFGIGCKIRVDPRSNQLCLWPTKDIESQNDR